VLLHRELGVVVPDVISVVHSFLYVIRDGDESVRCAVPRCGA
jgi:hypothetical protein